MTKDKNTEERIKEAASAIFIKKGLAGARMQEIADKAGINKALLHYYYRSKDKLFHAIFDEVIQEFAPKVLGALGSDLPLKEKLENYVEEYLNLLISKPFLPLFIFNELKVDPSRFVDKIGIKHSGVIEKLTEQLNSEVQKGHIRRISTIEFMINLFSLCLFPAMAQPLFQNVFQQDEQAFKQMMEARKKSIPEFMMAAISI